ncbi:hypothetical protein Sar04_38880 [Salinispora arenicola]|uniref:Uncharacterized protein n=1 Tax=Salinispora arenicola TaxID=168697 RepID=A0ABQ4JYZ6_SALAC|nr:hypothetical protein Sar04_38880 [Salinispora arenicola]
MSTTYPAWMQRNALKRTFSQYRRPTPDPETAAEGAFSHPASADLPHDGKAELVNA